MSENLRVVVGLGNPGPAYADNRHNVGFRVVEDLARRLGLSWRDGAEWAEARGRAPGGTVALVKPLAYMNRSGPALQAWSADAGIPLTGEPAAVPGDGTGPPDPGPDALRPLVVCDDLNLPLGSVRLRARGGSGGQNGLDSVLACLGGEEVPRLRLGVAPPDREVDPEDWADFVLADFAPDEREAAADLVAHAAAALESWLAHGFEATVSRYNRRVRPGTPPEE